MSSTIADLLPLGPTQRGMLAEETRHPGGTTNLVHVAARLVGSLDPKAFELAWQRVIERHVCLRSSFAWEGLREPVQVVHRAVATDVTLGVAADPAAWRQQAAAEHATALTDLRSAPLVRMALGSGPDGQHHLLWSYHHLVLDGWSSGIVMRELLAEHDALVHGEPSPLGPAGRYEDVVDRWRRASRDPAATRHWQQRLAGLRPALDRRADNQPPEPGSHHLLLDAGLAQRLDELGRRHRLTLSTLVHAAWAEVLAARTGAADVLLGSVDAGRPADLPGVERIVGPLLRTVPVRVPAGVEAPGALTDLQRRIRTDAERAEGLEWTAIAAAAGLPARATFDALVTVENYPDGLWQTGAGSALLQLADVTVTETPTAMLVLEAVPTSGGPVLRLVRDRHRVDDVTAEGLLRDVVGALGELVERPRRTASSHRPRAVGWGRAQPSAALEAAADPRHAANPAGTAGRVSAADPDDTVPARWQRTVSLYPDRVAVRDLQRSRTYSETDRAARAVAEALGPAREAGRRKPARGDREVLVGVLVERGVDLPAAILGVLLAGGAYVPLDPGSPDATLLRIVGRCGLAALVIDPSTAPRVAGLGIPLVDVTACSAVEAPGQGTVGSGHVAAGSGHMWPDPSEGVRGNQDAAYVIHTSGSTGVPKGVVVTHHNLLRLLDRAAEILPVTPADVWSCIHSAAFDFSIWELFGALLSGGEVVVLPDWVVRDPHALAAQLDARRVTILSSTPTAFAALAEAATSEQVDALAVRRVVFGGEALDPGRILRWQRLRGARTAWVNMYGITETTVHVTARVIDPIAAELARDSCLGQPLADLRIDLTDARGASVALDEVGELHVAGAGLARGYLDDPRTTADRFRPDPEATVPGARRYRTGDLAIRLPGGELGYRGRADRQVKVRGHRVEPGELEAVLAAHPGVGRAVVAADADGRLRAWATPGEAAAPCGRLLRAAQESDAQVVELGDLAVLHRNAAEALFTGDEVLGGAYLGPGLRLDPGDTVLDVGANAGVFAAWVALRQPGVRVHAVEPLGDVADLLRRNLAAHGVDATVHEVAAGADEGATTLTYYPNATVLSGGVDGRSAAGAWLRGQVPSDEVAASLVDDLLDSRLTTRRVTVPVTRLSTLIREAGLTRIDLLKIDVEGAEVDALAGVAEEDWPLVRRLAVEVHGRARGEALAARLRDRGYWVQIDQEAALAGTELVLLHARTPEALAADQAAPTEATGSAVTTFWHSPAALVRDLRTYLGEQLPSHLQPRSLHLVADLPTTSSGKLDRAALLAAVEDPGADAVTRTRAPRPGAEAALVATWGDVLAARTVDPDTDFFAAGGDSILCLTMLSRLRERGWALTPRQVFELRTPARLADAARPVRVEPAAPDEASDTGPVPLTPIQHWFLDLDVPRRSHWNQAVLVRLPAGSRADRVHEALQSVADRHDAFRLRFRRSGAGWEQVQAATAGPVGWSQVDSVERAATTHRSLDLTHGPTLAGALVGDGSQLLLVAHHLVIDAHSWSIVLRDLAVAHAAEGAPTPERPDATRPAMTFRRWAEQVAPHLPAPAAPDPGLGRESDAQRRELVLARDVTALLSAPLFREAALGPAELTLAALAHACATAQGTAEVTIEVERHGRDDPRTLDVVGWFTRFDPVTIRVPDSEDPIDLVHATARALHRGAGRAGPTPQPALTFNFVGETSGTAGPLTVLDTAVGPLHDPAARLPRRLTVEAGVRDGQLVCTVIADRSVPATEIGDLLAGTRVALQAQALTARHTVAAPLLELPRADLTTAELAELRRAVPDLTDAYPLTDVQAGLLFHTLFDGLADPYVNQFHWTLVGALDIAALAEAWRLTTERHPVLRTGVWTRSRRPHQLVHATGAILHVAPAGAPWSAIADAERAAVGSAGTAPLTRLAVVPDGPQRHRVIWTHHHLVIDGWSVGTVLADLHRAYAALAAGQPQHALSAEQPPSFADCVERLEDASDDAAERWQALLAGASSTLLLADREPTGRSHAQPSLVHREPTGSQAQGIAVAQREAATLNTLALAAWSLALEPLCGADLVIGNTVSGRSGGSGQEGAAELADVVGMLVNTLPVRLRLLPEMEVRTWLAAVQTVAVQAREHEHVPLTRILRWVGADPATQLFDTSVVVENLPEHSIGRHPVPGLTVQEVGSVVHNHYAATLRVIPRPTLALELLHDATRLPADRAAALLDRTCAALTALAEATGQPGKTVGQVREGLPALPASGVPAVVTP